jgi:hypothetical protein
VILSKVPLDEYLVRGLALAKRIGFDIESAFVRPAEPDPEREVADTEQITHGMHVRVRGLPGSRATFMVTRVDGANAEIMEMGVDPSKAARTSVVPLKQLERVRPPLVPVELAPESFEKRKTWRGKERSDALRAVHRTGENPGRSERQGRPRLEFRGRDEPRSFLAMYVHISGTRFDNTEWKLSYEAEGAKTRISLAEPITREVIEDAFHRELGPFKIETSADGGTYWTALLDADRQWLSTWDWESVLALASSLLTQGSTWNAVRVLCNRLDVSQRFIELVRYHRPDRELVPLYEREARIVIAELKSHVAGKVSDLNRTGPEVPSVSFKHHVGDSPIVIHVALSNGHIWCRSTMEGSNDTLWRASKHPLNEEGARGAAAEIVERFGHSSHRRVVAS